MCIFIIKHWMHPDQTLHMRGNVVEVCKLNIATPGSLPDDCADRRCIYLDSPERGPCPMCEQREAFAQHVQQSTTSVPSGTANDSQSGEGDSHPTPKTQGSSNLDSTPPAPVDIEGDTIPLLSQRNRQVSTWDPAGSESISRASISSGWSSRQSSLSICFPGRHDLEDVGDGGMRCRICHVISGQRASIQSWSGMYGTPEAFTDDDDGTSTVVSVHQGSFDVVGYQQYFRDESREQSVTLAETNALPRDATPTPASPAESTLSTATSALWREHDKAIRERNVSRNF
ncbi:hypothetical protein LTR85_012085 [Meristemomyces frigidus]|nr:hypothetical protein LTR85_012085 [Meristemomyces frigidus]